MIPVKQASKYYFVELVGALALYGAALVFRHGFAAAHTAPSLLKTVILLSPILPVCLAALAIIRLYQRTDEMYRRMMLENIAFGALFCAVSTIAWGFLTDVGAPVIGISWSWPLMGTGWLLISIWRGARMAVAERGAARTAKSTAVFFAFVGLPTLAYALAAPALNWPHSPGFVILVATGVFLIAVGYQTFRKGGNCCE